MTVDIRTAAEQEAAHRWPVGEQWSPKEVQSAQGRFIMGAVWAQSRLTPTREQLAERMFNAYADSTGKPWREEARGIRDLYLEQADAVFALLQELARGEG